MQCRADWHRGWPRLSRALHEFARPHNNAEYAKVLRMLGNGRLEAYCFDGKNRQCHIRGKMRKKVRVLCPRAALGAAATCNLLAEEKP